MRVVMGWQAALAAAINGASLQKARQPQRQGLKPSRPLALRLGEASLIALAGRGITDMAGNGMGIAVREGCRVTTLLLSRPR